MNKILLLPVLSLALLSRVNAEQMVEGSTTGTFSNEASSTGGTTSASGTTWTYYNGTGNASTVVVTGDNFGPSLTPLTTLLATLTVNNGGNGGGNDVFTADLNLLISFTTPAGQSTNLIDGLQLTTDTGGPGNDTLDVSFGGLPGPQSFSFGGFTYTVTLDGYFDAATGGNSISDLVVYNPGGNNTTSGNAYLRGTITSMQDIGTASAVPEPSSVIFLATVIAGVVWLRLRNKFKLGVQHSNEV